MTSVGGMCDEHGNIYKWTDQIEYDSVRLPEEKDQMKGEIYSLRMNLIRVSSELDTEKSLRTMADQQLRHALSLLRDSVRNYLYFENQEHICCSWFVFS
jgi:hypothetical protein